MFAILAGNRSEIDKWCVDTNTPLQGLKIIWRSIQLNGMGINDRRNTVLCIGSFENNPAYKSEAFKHMSMLGLVQVYGRNEEI